MLEQPRIAPLLLVAVVDLAGALLLQHLADHFLAIDPHAEVGDRCALRHREGVERLDLALLGVLEDLRDVGDGDAVVDGDVDVVLLDLQHAAEAAVGNEQAGGVGRGR